MELLATAAFVAIFFLDVPFPLIIIAAGLVAYLGGHRRPELFGVIQAKQAQDGDGQAAPLIRDDATNRERPSRRRSLRVATTWLLIWWAPVGLLVLGLSHVFVQEAWFFSKAAVVTFGGAYAVLAYIAQRAVEDSVWLQPGEMLDGLGMAETTLGLLIQVVQFVGFMGALRNPGALNPLTAGILASVIVTWVTFVPCFLWIFLGAPYIEHLRGKQGLTHALSGITAAVVGVILNLAIWFSLHILFPGIQERTYGPVQFLVPTVAVDWAALAIAADAFVAPMRLRWNMLVVIGLATGAGLAYRLAIG